MNKKSRPSTRLFRSVVTRLLILPIRFPLAAAGSTGATGGSWLFFAAGSVAFFVAAVEAVLITLARTVSSSLAFDPDGEPCPALSSSSAIDALSGVCAAVVTRLAAGDSVVSAFMRIRSA